MLLVCMFSGLFGIGQLIGMFFSRGRLFLLLSYSSDAKGEVEKLKVSEDQEVCYETCLLVMAEAIPIQPHCSDISLVF